MANYLVVANGFYVFSAFMFIFGLKLLGSPATARKGNFLSALAMFVAVIVTLLDQKIINYEVLVATILLGSLVGVVVAKYVKMTSMPELVSLLNGVGGLASLFLAWGATQSSYSMEVSTQVTVAFAILIGCVTFSGSIIAWAKLSETIKGAPFILPGQALISISVVAAIFAAIGMFAFSSHSESAIWWLIGLSFVLGLLVVLPIGGADMPVVISLLNSYSGLAACAAGFAINNNLLIVAGSLVGASGVILTGIMCKAMNRSLSNVLFSGFQSAPKKSVAVEQGEVKALSAEDAYYVLEAAQSVVVIPGYGMAVAQAQHVVKELQEHLEKNDAEVVYGIHPVAGRMPGHMNVLLAEADISYELLLEMDDINQKISNFDVAIVIGANDVVNPAARELEGSPIYGMPVINADLAKNVFVLKRGMASGFAGVDNPLFFKDNCRMIFGDAKETLGSLVRQFSN